MSIVHEELMTGLFHVDDSPMLQRRRHCRCSSGHTGLRSNQRLVCNAAGPSSQRCYISVIVHRGEFSMRKLLTALALALCASPMVTLADTVQMPSSDAAAAPASLPRKGTTMHVVLKQYGEPKLKHAPVGGDTPKHPPITRWDYPGFSVFFERNHVVDAVVPGAPTQVYHTDQLTPAS
jgi:hypothetical protein